MTSTSDVAHSIPEVRHGPGNSIVAPRSVLSREADNQLFNFIVDSWSPRIRPVLGTVELPGDELAVPPENRIGPDDTRYLFERSLAELFSDLGQCLSSVRLRSGASDPGFDFEEFDSRPHDTRSAGAAPHPRTSSSTDPEI